MKKYLVAVFPSMAVTLGLLILPVALSIAYFVAGYAKLLVNDPNINYFDVHNSILGKLVYEQSWLQWVNRFMDFALWGTLAAIGLVLIWLVSSARIALKNHYTVEGFENFRSTHSSWHTHFIVVALLKVFLCIAIVYSGVSILINSSTKLQAGIFEILQGYNQHDVIVIITAAASIFAFEYLIVTFIKVFKHLSVD